jgi:hypothetical protein
MAPFSFAPARASRQAHRAVGQGPKEDRVLGKEVIYEIFWQ